MLYQLSNKPWFKNGFVSVCLLAVMTGVQLAAWARPMNGTENAAWIANDCFQEPNTVRSDNDCVDDKCDAAHDPITDAAQNQLCKATGKPAVQYLYIEHLLPFD